jgi:predicted enzyme related to lactoylglutathione lyase
MAQNFCWYELMTPDVEGAKAYYGAVIGWDAENGGPGNDDYTMLLANGRRVAGILETPAHARAGGAPPIWLGYIEVDDCDATAARIEQAGGTIHRQPTDIPGIGRFAVTADPQGAIFYIMTPLPIEVQPPVPLNTPGHAAWRELYAADGEAAFRFYAEQFGWTADEAMDMGGMGKYQLFAAGAEAIGGMMTKPASIPRPFWLYYFAVEDIDAATRRVTTNGGELLEGPMQVPGGVWIIQAKDPQGAMFALVGPRASHNQGETR